MKKLSKTSLDNYQKCGVCYYFYGSELTPLVLKCGHSFCNVCLKKLFENYEGKIQCPLDKRFLEYSSIEEIPTNYSFLQLLQTLSYLKISENCKFQSENLLGPTSEINVCSFKEFIECKTILEMNFIQIQPNILSAKELVYTKIFKKFNSNTLYQKFKESKVSMNVQNKIYNDGEFFQGVFQYGKKNGWGRKRHSYGLYYEGFYSDGEKNGIGIEINPKLEIYIGEFQNNLKNGEGSIFYNNMNTKYEGKFFDNKKHGYGEEYFQDGSTYKGQYSDGNRSGQGEMKYPNGNFLKGEFFCGKLNGQGKEQSETYRYKGSFREGLKHDYGVLVFNNGSMYKGTFLNNKFHGKGVFSYSNGNSYEGDFFEGKKHGTGSFKVMSKENSEILLTYTGEFINDYFDGEGNLETKHGTKYKGQFCKGKKNGYGIIIYPNGDEYRGMFENDQKNGRGEIFYNYNGSIIGGFWDNNKLVNKEFSIPSSELDDVSMYNF